MQNETAHLGEPSDEQLCVSAQEGDGQAADLLVRRFSRMVKTCARPYYLAGGDSEDLLQEGMLGLIKAVREFDAGYGAPFAAFARLCITQSLQAAVRAAAAQKHTPLNHSISTDRPLFDGLTEAGGQGAVCSPESLVIDSEQRREQMDCLLRRLSAFEAKVLSLYLQGYGYEQMAKMLGKTEKSVDNAIQRIKRKSLAVNFN